MAGRSDKMELENDRVRVTRVKMEGRERRPPTARGDRLVIYLRDAHITRTENGRTEKLHRKAGDVVWRPRSTHVVESDEDAGHEVLVVELK